MILESWRRVAESLPVNPFYSRAIPHIKANGRVLDAGAGFGQGARLLRERGFSATCLEPDSEMADNLRQQGFPVIEGTFADAPAKSFDAVLTVFSLFFVAGSDFPASWDAISNSIDRGGIWAGQLLGPNDEWANSGDVLVLETDDIARLLKPFEVLEWEEVDRPGRTAWGAAKHWHIHHIIARRT